MSLPMRMVFSRNHSSVPPAVSTSPTSTGFNLSVNDRDGCTRVYQGCPSYRLRNSLSLLAERRSQFVGNRELYRKGATIAVEFQRAAPVIGDRRHEAASERHAHHHEAHGVVFLLVSA